MKLYFLFVMFCSILLSTNSFGQQATEAGSKPNTQAKAAKEIPWAEPFPEFRETDLTYKKYMEKAYINRASIRPKLEVFVKARCSETCHILNENNNYNYVGRDGMPFHSEGIPIEITADIFTIYTIVFDVIGKEYVAMGPLYYTNRLKPNENDCTDTTGCPLGDGYEVNAFPGGKFAAADHICNLMGLKGHMVWFKDEFEEGKPIITTNNGKITQLKCKPK